MATSADGQVSLEGTPDQLRERVDAARVQVLEEREKLARWKTKKADAAIELENVQRRAGVELLEDPDAEESIATTIAGLNSRIDLAERATIAQEPRIAEAERRYLTAEADSMEPAVEVAREALRSHEARTDRLLKQLEAHEGPHISMWKHRQVISDAATSTVMVVDNGSPIRPPRSVALRATVRRLEREVALVRELAAGRDPEDLIRRWQGPWGEQEGATYPACLAGPDALVSTPQYLRQVERAHETIAALEEGIEIAEREADQYSGRLRLPGDEGAAAKAALTRRLSRLADMPAELDAARRHLAVLTGAAQA